MIAMYIVHPNMLNSETALVSIRIWIPCRIWAAVQQLALSLAEEYPPQKETNDTNYVTLAPKGAPNRHNKSVFRNTWGDLPVIIAINEGISQIY